jgi:hypothetical protein
MSAIGGLVLTTLALVVSLAFNYLQYKWRKEEREQIERQTSEAKAEQRRKERRPPEIYNAGGSPNPIRITGSQHSVQGPYVYVWGAITVVNPTQGHMKITPLRLVIGGVDWETTRLAFHSKSNDRERSDRISMLGNDKQDYNLHFLFPETKVPKGMSGELWLTSSNRTDEPFSILVSFA